MRWNRTRQLNGILSNKRHQQVISLSFPNNRMTSFSSSLFILNLNDVISFLFLIIQLNDVISSSIPNNEVQSHTTVFTWWRFFYPSFFYHVTVILSTSLIACLKLSDVIVFYISYSCYRMTSYTISLHSFLTIRSYDIRCKRRKFIHDN